MPASSASEKGEILRKPVMSDEDYRKCGARPPQPQSASVGSSAPR
jgi:hypothetical protein